MNLQEYLAEKDTEVMDVGPLNMLAQSESRKAYNWEFRPADSRTLGCRNGPPFMFRLNS